ncbi:MAG: helix-turn-helix domain-containing protein [Brevundimonas sp.]|uniref:helix-turn-helix domain-containing protein n=1 Tax=Brevundimonas sp. TaxID=1871086 RepID=UPI0040331FB9
MEPVAFASPPRIGDDALSYARQMLRRGVGWQNTSRATGIPVEDLRRLAAPPAARSGYRAPKPAARPRVVPAKPTHKPARCSQNGLAIIREVADRYQVQVNDLLGVSRARYVSFARMEAYALIRRRTPYSLPQIGLIFDGRDHTTILHGVRHYEAREAWCAVLRVFSGYDDSQPDLFAVAA